MAKTLFSRASHFLSVKGFPSTVTLVTETIKAEISTSRETDVLLGYFLRCSERTKYAANGHHGNFYSFAVVANLTNF